MRPHPAFAAMSLGLALAVVTAPAEAQERQCDLIDRGQNARTEQVEVGGTTFINFLDPFLFRCTDGTELRANRGSLNQLTRELQLWGDVFFQDPVRSLTADQATYQSPISRLHATGNVVFRNLEEGSTIRGPDLEYFSATESRPESQVHARQRPHLTLQPRDRSEDAEPLEIDADRVTIIGQDQLNAAGTVVITRSDMRATANEAQYNGATGGLELRGNAAIESQEYDLAGNVIQAQTDDGVLRHVHARTDASLVGEDLTVTAPDLQLFFEDELLNRAVARVGRARDEAAGAPASPERAIARSPTFVLSGDSIDARIPGQKIEQVTAIGRARGESIDTAAVADSPRLADMGEAGDEPALAREPSGPPAAERDPLIDSDWIRGDTIIGYFSSAESTETPGDTAVVLDRLVAVGAALSLYRVLEEGAPADSRRGINFLAGDLIELSFVAGELELAEVDGLQKGLFLDPAPAPGTTQTAARREGG